MGKVTGFLDYKRKVSPYRSVKERVKDWDEFYTNSDIDLLKLQGARCMDCGVPFCHSGMAVKNTSIGCPLNNLIPEWNDLVYKGEMDEAYRRLAYTSNFPEFTGRVCPALCEGSCTAGFNFDVVTVKNVERHIIDNAWDKGLVVPRIPKSRKKKTVAVIGSGPAGLACADELNQMGYNVTVFEKSDRAGGLLMYGIPNMKLDKEIVLRRIHLMEEEGIVFKCNVEVGKDYSFNQIDDDFDAVVLCCGAQRPRTLNVEGSDLNGVYYALNYLSTNTKSLLDTDCTDKDFINAEGKNVIIVGGGDTGTDCVATAIRQGAKSVEQLEIMAEPSVTRGSDNPWPEWPRIKRTDYGHEEAISVFGKDPRRYLTTVTRLEGDKFGNVKNVHISKVEWVKNDGGIMIPKPKKGTEKALASDMVIVATGFIGVEEEIINTSEVKGDLRGNIFANDYKTSKQGFFAAGDCRRGQSLVVWAIREGKGAARAVNNYLI